MSPCFWIFPCIAGHIYRGMYKICLGGVTANAKSTKMSKCRITHQFHPSNRHSYDIKETPSNADNEKCCGQINFFNHFRIFKLEYL